MERPFAPGRVQGLFRAGSTFAKSAGRFVPALLLVTFLGVTLLSSLHVARAAEPPPAVATPEELRVLFLYNFAKFVRWPPRVMGTERDPIRVGVLSDAPLLIAANLIADRKAQRRPVEFHACLTREDMLKCHILYFNDPDDLRVKSALALVKGSHILTVGDGESFNRWGGIIAFHEEEQRLHFSVRLDAAKRAGLRLSSQLIEVSDQYREAENP